MSTIMRMMCRGVRNWPFTPAVDSLESRYSYTSPRASPFFSWAMSAEMLSMAETILSSISGVGTLKMASPMYLE